MVLRLLVNPDDISHGPSSLLRKRISSIFARFTVIAKDGDRIVGVQQWHIKEDPRAGVAEFEELFVLPEYRGKGCATAMLQFAVQSVRERFAASLQMAKQKCSTRSYCSTHLPSLIKRCSRPPRYAT